MPGFELVGKEELEAIQEIFQNSNGVLFAHGFDARRNRIFRVREFEKKAASYFKCAHAVAVSSGTAAQFVALKALGIGPGDEVITQAFTFVATAEAIIECGATPVVVDCDETLNMSPDALKKAITSRTKAIVPVHMLGTAARMDEILEIASQKKIPVIEDACEALGGSYKGKSLGTLGDMGFFSLDFGKTITCGEGGLILTNNEKHHKFMSAFHDHGHENRPDRPRGKDTASFSGFNFRMTEMQAAVGMAQLKKLDFILEKNKKHKARLKSAVEAGLGSRIEMRTLADPAGDICDTLMFYLPTKESAEKTVSGLLKHGIDTRNVPSAMDWHFAGNWPQMWKNHPLYKDSFKTTWDRTRNLLERCIALTVLVKITDEELDRMADTIIRVVKEST